MPTRKSQQGLVFRLQRDYVGICVSFHLESIGSHIRAVGRLWREGAMALSITTNKTDGVIVVRLGGAIYFGEESSSLRIRVKELLEKSSQIVLDLENITRIDSGGLGTLVALYTSARKMGGDIKLANLGNHVKEVLQITRLVTVFEIFGSTVDAVASFNRAAAKR